MMKVKKHSKYKITISEAEFEAILTYLNYSHWGDGAIEDERKHAHGVDRFHKGLLRAAHR